MHSFTLYLNIDYVYNTQGLRTSKVIVDEYAGGNISHTYKYCGNKLIEEEVNDDIKGDYYKLQFLYDESELLYGFKYENKEYYYLRDSLQTIIGIENELKQIVCEYKYDAYGNHKVLDNNRNVSNSKYFIGNINPFRYKGYYYDVETGLYWISSRYYSPELCRWISSDDVEYLDPESVNGLNLYAYCGNNPVNNYDPTGHLFWSCLLGAAISLVVELAIDYFEDDSRTLDHSIKDYLVAGISGAISGGFGASKNFIVRLGGAVVSSVAQGVMTEGLDYNLNSLKQDVIIGFVSFGIAEGISIASKRIVGGLIKKASQKTTKEAGRQISSMMKGNVVKNLKPNAKKIYRKAILGIIASKTNEHGTGALYSFITGISNSTIFEW